jgi:hypothetical protein
MSAPVAPRNNRVAVDTTSAVPGRPGGSTGLTGPIYRIRSRGRVEIRTARGNWQRVRLVPVGGVRFTPPKPAA